jgi:nucleoside-diphosphate-sugar epimerase
MGPALILVGGGLDDSSENAPLAAELAKQRNAMDPILVTGGTGTLGRHVVHRLREAGRDVRVLTRRTGVSENGVRFVTGDLLSNIGIDVAVAGVATIIHCAGNRKGDDAATQNLTQ